MIDYSLVSWFFIGVLVSVIWCVVCSCCIVLVVWDRLFFIVWVLFSIIWFYLYFVSLLMLWVVVV